MGRNYKSPPLIEALCEFRFINKHWDMTMPGLFYQKVKDDFPTIREKNVVEMLVNQQQPGQEVHGVMTPRIQFINHNESALLQLGPGILIVNCLRPYPSWPNFKELIFQTLAQYKEITSTVELERIGLRFINKIDLPLDKETKTQFNYYPHLPALPANEPKNFLLRTELDFEQSNGVLVLTLAIVPPEKDDVKSLILDLDFVSLHADRLTFETIESWVESAHHNIETAFEASIMDSLRVTFEE
ncbi:MAG: TIGR04255 family protein [Chloroflexi bacterium]|nr:TIGR04255 family protein [Chloroflexota bacterium]